MKIDAITGATVNFTQDQAKAIALQQFKGDVKDIQLTKENGKEVYVIVNHKTPREIFEANGFDVNVIGMKRVEQCADRWKKAYIIF